MIFSSFFTVYTNKKETKNWVLITYYVMIFIDFDFKVNNLIFTPTRKVELILKWRLNYRMF